MIGRGWAFFGGVKRDASFLKSLYTLIRMYVDRVNGALAKKVKVTLSLREDIVKRAKSKLAMEGGSLSDLVEEFLSTYDELGFLDGLCRGLGFESRFYTSLEVEADRPRGLRAEEVVREIRDERSKRLLGH